MAPLGLFSRATALVLGPLLRGSGGRGAPGPRQAQGEDRPWVGASEPEAGSGVRGQPTEAPWSWCRQL